MSRMTKQQAYARICELRDEAEKCLREARELADKHDESFAVNLGSQTITYDPVSMREEPEEGWTTSSQRC